MFAMDISNEDWSDIDESGDEDDKKKRKRVRTTTVTIACEACRQKHLKCDGTQPICLRCTRSGQECVWNTKRRKRGRAKGWQNQQSGQASVDNIGVKPAENDVAETALVSAFLSVYVDHVQPLVGISPPFKDVVSLRAHPTKEDKRMMLQFAVLAHGARLCGQPARSEEYDGKARQLVMKYFDETDPQVAATFALMSYHYANIGIYDKSVYYCDLGLKMMQNLLGKPVDWQSAGVQSAFAVYSYCLLSEAYVTLEPGRKIALIDRFVSTMSQLKSSEPAVKFYETIGRILLQTVEACFHPRDKVVDCIERTAAICGSVPLAVKMQPKMWVRLESMRMASSALLHAMVGNITEALQLSDDVYTILSNAGPLYHDCFAASSFYLSAQVDMRFAYTRYHRDIRFLEQVAATQQSARILLDLLSQRESELSEARRTNPDAVFTHPYVPMWFSDAKLILAMPSSERLLEFPQGVESVPVVGTWKSLPYTKHEFHHFVTPLLLVNSPTTPVSSAQPTPRNDSPNEGRKVSRIETIDTPVGSHESEHGDQSSTEEIARPSPVGQPVSLSPGAPMGYPQSPWEGAHSTWPLHQHLPMGIGIGQPIIMPHLMMTPIQNDTSGYEMTGPPGYPTPEMFQQVSHNHPPVPVGHSPSTMYPL